MQRLIDVHDGVPAIELDFRSPFELLVATILSAQSTDKVVNGVTPALFATYPRPEDFAAADEEALQRQLYPTGFYRQKTKSVMGMSAALIERHGGEVPRTMKELTALPGVARKTANVVLGSALPQAHAADPDAGIAVDTHVKRLSLRLGLTRHDDPVKIERDLQKVIPRRQWTDASLAIILHGRRVCDATWPRCAECVVEPLCPSSLAAGKRDLARQAKGMGT